MAGSAVALGSYGWWRAYARVARPLAMDRRLPEGKKIRWGQDGLFTS